MKTIIIGLFLAVAGCIFGYALGKLALFLTRTPGTLYCTIDGRPSFIVEDADDIALAGNVWAVETEAVSYRYVQRQGEACNVEDAE